MGGGGLLRHDVVREIAAKHGPTPAQVVLRWHIEQGLVPLAKTTTVARVPENLAACDVELGADDMERMRALDRPDGNTQSLPDNWNSPFKMACRLAAVTAPSS